MSSTSKPQSSEQSEGESSSEVELSESSAEGEKRQPMNIVVLCNSKARKGNQINKITSLMEKMYKNDKWKVVDMLKLNINSSSPLLSRKEDSQEEETGNYNSKTPGSSQEAVPNTSKDDHPADSSDSQSSHIQPDQQEKAVAKLLAKEVDKGVEYVFIAGGDGTLSKVVVALYWADLHNQVKVGIIPSGTGNGFAKELGLPISTSKCLNLFSSPKKNRTRSIDLIEVGGRVCLLHIDAGLGAKICESTSSSMKKVIGPVAYLFSSVKVAATSSKKRKYTVKIDGSREKEIEATEMIIANAGSVGLSPKWRWGEGIQPDSHKLDLCFITVDGPFDLAKAWWALMNNTADDNPQFQRFSVFKSVTVSTDEPIPMEADGEVIGTTPFTANILPAAISCLVPVDEQVKTEE